MVPNAQTLIYKYSKKLKYYFRLKYGKRKSIWMYDSQKSNNDFD